MAVISNTDYKSIATSYNTAVASLSGVSTNYFDAAYLIVLLNTFDPEIDLLIPFFNAHQTSIQAYANAPQTIVNAVNALQNHVLSRGTVIDTATYGTRYTSIDDFYADQSTADPAGTGDFTVATGAPLGADFATLSNQAGFTINTLYHL